MTQPKNRSLRLFALVLLTSCSGSTCGSAKGGLAGGCGGLTPYAPGTYFPDGQKLNYAAQTRITGPGLDFLETNMNRLIETVTNSATGDHFISCIDQKLASIPLLGQIDALIGDQNENKACDPGEGFWVHVDIAPGSMHLDTINPDVLRLSMKLDISSSGANLGGQVTADPNQDGVHVVASSDICPHLSFSHPLGPWSCIGNYDTGSSPLSVAADLELTVDSTQSANHPLIQLTIPANSVQPLASNPGSAITAPPLEFQQSQCTGNVASVCSAAPFLQAIIGPLANLLAPILTQQVQTLLDAQTCTPCEAMTNACYHDTGWDAVCNTSRKGLLGGAGVCEYSVNGQSTGQCVPRLLGLAGTMDLGATLGAFGVDPSAAMDLYLAAGGSMSPVDSHNASNSACDANGTWNAADCARVPPNDSHDPLQGVHLGLTGGTNYAASDGISAASPCVPPQNWDWSMIAQPSKIDFQGEITGLNADRAIAQLPALDASKLFVGVGVAGTFVNKLLYDVYSAGALCLNITSSTSSFISTGTFNTFLPSLHELTHGADAPMIIAMRPKSLPTVRVGRNTTQMDAKLGKIPLDPLLHISIPDVHLDFYALIEDRYVRLFTLATSIDLPLSVDVTPAGNAVTPVLGSLGSVLGKTSASNSEMLADDLSAVTDLLKLATNLAQPLIANVLSQFALPDVLGLRLRILALNGVVPMTAGQTDCGPTTGPGCEHIGIFAGMCFVGGDPSDPASCPDSGNGSYSVHTRAALEGVTLPTIDALRAGKLPEVRLAVSALSGRTAETQYSYRVDGGLWQMWRRADAGLLALSDGSFMLQGVHRIEVRAKDEDLDASADRTPVSVEVLIDWEAPVVKLVLDGGTLKTLAQDNVTARELLQFSYRAAGGEWTAYGASKDYPLTAVGGEDGALQVRVRDGAGNVAEAAWGDTASLGEAATLTPAKLAAAKAQGGCASAQGGWSALAVLGLAALRRRRRL